MALELSLALSLLWLWSWVSHEFLLYCSFNYYILILVGPIRIGLTFTRASSARPSRQLGFPTDVLLLLLLSLLSPLEVVFHVKLNSALSSYCCYCIMCSIDDDVVVYGDIGFVFFFLRRWFLRLLLY